ncbi:hypothetical protein NKH18_41080 [Streptomyces sp. M10(2022)]
MGPSGPTDPRHRGPCRPCGQLGPHQHAPGDPLDGATLTVHTVEAASDDFGRPPARPSPPGGRRRPRGRIGAPGPGAPRPWPPRVSPGPGYPPDLCSGPPSSGTRGRRGGLGVRGGLRRPRGRPGREEVRRGPPRTLRRSAGPLVRRGVRRGRSHRTAAETGGAPAVERGSVAQRLFRLTYRGITRSVSFGAASRGVRQVRAETGIFMYRIKDGRARYLGLYSKV